MCQLYSRWFHRKPGRMHDWYVYAAFTLYFASKFFPKGDDTVKLLLFYLSFFNAPIGECIMGIYAYC